MKEAIYKIFDLAQSETLGLVGFISLFGGMFIETFILGNKHIECYSDFLIFIIPAIPALFFITWLIFALIVLGIENLIIAPIEFVVYSLGIPKIKINVDVIWKYQQKKS